MSVSSPKYPPATGHRRSGESLMRAGGTKQKSAAKNSGEDSNSDSGAKLNNQKYSEHKGGIL